MPVRQMETSPKGLRLIKQFEGFETKAYQDLGGVWTIGYGHTGSEVHGGQTITPDEAQELLESDLEIFESCVTRAITAPMNQNQFDAFVTLAYNIGCGAFGRSTLVRRFNDNDCSERVVEAWAWWNRVNGKRTNGLINRRRAEIGLFLAPI